MAGFNNFLAPGGGAIHSVTVVGALGHANVSTTQRYMHLDDRELADAQDLVE